MLTGARRKLDPPCDQNSKHVAMGEESNVARRGANPGDDAVDPRPDLVRALAARTAVPEDRPPRSLQMDLLGRESLVLTVVPFLQVGLERRAPAEARELTGLECATEGAREDELERLLGQDGTQAPRERPTVLGERDIGRSGVLSAQAPFSFAVADREDALRAGHCDSIVGRRQKSAAVSRREVTALSSTPQRHSRISGMSSPCRAMYCLCSISLSRIACLA